LGGYASLSSGDAVPRAAIMLQGAPAGTGTFTVTGSRVAPISEIATAGLHVLSDDATFDLDATYSAHFSNTTIDHTAELNLQLRL